MADIRIKDLTTTASSTASDDFIAVDGTTNGTRKLNAFSPTFGGNATVTGTLTVSGTSATVGSGTGSIASTLNGVAGNYKLNVYQSGGSDRWYVGIAAGAESGSNGGAPYTITALTDAGSVIDNPLLITRAAGGSITTPRPVAISSTTASTTTSSGALVVGNGTSGGLGVGGAIFAGDSVTIPNAKNFVVRNAAGSSTGMRMYADSSDYGYIDCTANTELRLQVGAGTKLSITNTGNVSIPATTASTSTSSGALVVSGGVGVAGAQYLGVKLNISTHDSSTGGIGFGTDINLYRSAANTLALDTTGNAAVLNVRENGTLTAAIGTVTGDLYLQTQQASKKVYIKTASAVTAATFDENQKATFAATIKTAAPAGGTAAEWKLGTVATVSPTSPNRTIEVDIGGTIYYLAAKTTNN